jgi:hypothetical protein
MRLPRLHNTFLSLTMQQTLSLGVEPPNVYMDQTCRASAAKQLLSTEGGVSTLPAYF